MTTNAIRIVVADDHVVTRGPLCERLGRELDFEVVGEAADGVEAVYLARLLDPDVVVMDLSMPRMNGARACAEIVRDRPSVRLVVLTGYASTIDPRSLRALGVSGFVSKTASFEHLAETVRAVHRGERPIGAEAPKDGGAGVEGPTLRELEVLQLVADGLHNNEIAARLCVGVKTVEFHIANLRGKLTAGSRVELVRAGRRFGWLGEDAPTH